MAEHTAEEVKHVGGELPSTKTMIMSIFILLLVLAPTFWLMTTLH
ncbi:hypothetical protein [Formicincola oecophyllae]|nr:hypothetical protein [Formicincola oecophyllae]